MKNVYQETRECGKAFRNNSYETRITRKHFYAIETAIVLLYFYYLYLLYFYYLYVVIPTFRFQIVSGLRYIYLSLPCVLIF